ncbi:MAG: hypothetical protein IJ673_06370, partial [Treponema sp.]|nr:hypothetical protein [Treponema sp.]
MDTNELHETRRLNLGVLPFIGGKLIRLSTVLFAISVICFALMAFSPMDPLIQYLGGEHIV